MIKKLFLKYETEIRTIDSMFSIVFQMIQVALTLYGLHYIMHHPH